MDPMIDFVRDRTDELQRVAADLRRAREPRTIEPTTVTVAAATPRLVEREATEAACCDGVRPSASARPAA